MVRWDEHGQFGGPEGGRMTNDEVRTELRQLLDGLRRDLLRMGAMVTEGLSAVTVALLAGDLDAANEIVQSDDELDLLSIEAEEACIRILALQAPVATDLRVVVTDLKMVGEIERSGDLVTNIAKAIPRLHGAMLDPRLRGLLDQMREQCVLLFGLAMDAYTDRDAEIAGSLRGLDDTLDALHNEFIDALFSSRSSDALSMGHTTQLAVIGRFYERIGDHAVNIAERVTYLVTGSLPEHAGAGRARQVRDLRSDS